MNFHIYWGLQLIASFAMPLHRDIAFDALVKRFPYAIGNTDPVFNLQKKDTV